MKAGLAEGMGGGGSFVPVAVVLYLLRAVHGATFPTAFLYIA